ncbi:hypothetical protein [Hafnia alvei]|uniref:hypothetical protein n=1 Tax=Hafnia alvei TaxID=569 RepID=UPI0012D484FB|nr:hypothetical protein [Hafnia alvei]MBW3477395.1 hypothetical protein [Hafnia alvei]
MLTTTNVYLSVNGIKGVYGQVRDKPELLIDYTVSSMNDESPDMYGANEIANIQISTITSLPVGCGVVFYYKPTSSSGVIAKRSATGIDISTMNFGTITPVGSLTCDVSGEFTIMAEPVNSVSTITVKPTKGAVVQQSVADFYGGKIARINKSGTGAAITMRSAAQYVI